MKRLIIAGCLGLGLVGSAIAGPLTRGIEFTGGENALANLVLQRAQNIVVEDGVLKLQVAINQAQKLKGYGFVLQYDQSKYEFGRSASDRSKSARCEWTTRAVSRVQQNARASGCWRDEGSMVKRLVAMAVWLSSRLTPRIPRLHPIFRFSTV